MLFFALFFSESEIIGLCIICCFFWFAFIGSRNGRISIVVPRKEIYEWVHPVLKYPALLHFDTFTENVGGRIDLFPRFFSGHSEFSHEQVYYFNFFIFSGQSYKKKVDHSAAVQISLSSDRGQGRTDGAVCA